MLGTQFRGVVEGYLMQDSNRHGQANLMLASAGYSMTMLHRCSTCCSALVLQAHQTDSSAACAPAAGRVNL
jgi:hypothetical protein